jgi:hypothetical protein
MNSDTFFLFILVFASIGLGIAFGAIAEKRTWQNDLIERNLAEWQVDAKTGKTEFVIFEKNEPR